MMGVLAALGVGAWALTRADDGEPPAGEAQGYWLGPSIAGYSLQPGTEAIYGDCDIPPNQTDGGCAPPLEVQTHRTCETNPVSLGLSANRVFRLRGGAIAVDYGDQVNVGLGTSTVLIFANNPRVGPREAAPKLRLRSASAPPHRYPPPRYPLAVLEELKRVVVARRRFGTPRRIGRELGLPAKTVSTRLRVADLLPRGEMRRVAVPTLSARQIERNRQLAFEIEESNERPAAQELGISQAELVRRLRSVRGLTTTC